MKCIKLSIFSSLAIIASLISASCSSDVETVAEESAVETTDDGTAQEEEVTTSPLITVTINNATKNTVTYSRAIQTDDEQAVDSMKFYIFREIDGVFYFYSNPDFTPDDDEITYSYSIYDDIYLLGETIQVLLVANDKVTVSEETDKDVLTLEEFKKSLATASVSTGDNVDVLVGGFPGSSSVTGFPMTATATNADDGNEEFEVTIAGVELEATLIRTMARIDIINYASNLTVTDVYVSNTPNKSYLFGQDELAEPTTSDDSGFEYVTLKALSAYFDELGDFITENDFASTDENTDVTTMEQVLYMYEQSYSGTYPTVYISYAIDNSEYAGTVGVAFSSYNVTRNYRYIIELAKDAKDTDSDGKQEVTFSADVTVTVTVDDWELGEAVEETLEFGTEDDTESEDE